LEESGAASSAPRAGRESSGDEGVSIALACRAFGVSETCFHYSPKRDEESELIADLLVGLTKLHKTWGFGLCLLHLRRVKGRAGEPHGVIGGGHCLLLCVVTEEEDGQ